MNADLKKRTLDFSVDMLNFLEILPENLSTKLISAEIFSCSSSIGVIYRGAIRSANDVDFVLKIEKILEKIDQLIFLLEIINAKKLADSKIIAALKKEANELFSIFQSVITSINKRTNKRT